MSVYQSFNFSVNRSNVEDISIQIKSTFIARKYRVCAQEEISKQNYLLFSPGSP